MHLRKFDPNANKYVDETVTEINLSQKVEEALERIKYAINTGKYSLASISKEHGFIDMLPELLKKEGLT